MQLKLLLVPFLVILSLILAIGYIKPDFDKMHLLKEQVAEKKNEVNEIEKVVGNIDAFDQQLQNQKEDATFLTRYYPAVMDQDRVIDAFNYLANQSGLLVIDVQIMEPEKEVVAETTSVDVTPGITPSASGEIVPATGETVPALPAYVPPRSKSYIAQVTVQGQYENLKAFLDRLNHMDRFAKLRAFSLGVREEVVGGQVQGDGAPSTDLTASFTADFNYLPLPKGANALQVPVFRQDTLDLGPIAKAKERITASVPELTKGDTGKANPFQ